MSNVEDKWPQARVVLTRTLWYDDRMPRLPRWRAADLERFAAAHPREAEQMRWLRWRGQMLVRSVAYCFLCV